MVWAFTCYTNTPGRKSHLFNEYLKPGRHSLLVRYICDVCIKEYLPKEIAFPRCGCVLFFLCLGIVELVAVLLVCEIQVYIAVVIGKLTLGTVYPEPAERHQNPDYYAPIMFGCERHRLECLSCCNGKIYAEKPTVTGKTVKNAPPACLLACYACQLSVGAVVEVCPHKQQYT